MSTPTQYPPPIFVTPTSLLPLDTLYAYPGNLFSYNFTIRPHSVLGGVSLQSLLPLPQGAWLDRPIIRGSNYEVTLYWEPTEDHHGNNILCFVARDGFQSLTTPLCLIVVVTDELTEVRIVVCLFVCFLNHCCVHACSISESIHTITSTVPPLYVNKCRFLF